MYSANYNLLIFIMHENQLIGLILFIGFFLVLTTLIKWLSEKTSFPYTIALLFAGVIGQILFHGLDVNLHLNLSTDVIYFVLLPLLLFESATHIQLHQFRLQFKTITFLATFGLLASVAVVGGLMALLLGIPLGVGLLFGTIISATDPIAVLALFKTLKAPKRLALLIEGESMFNDATAVILFRIVSAVVVGHAAFQSHHLALSTMNFLYVFIGSIVAGAIMAGLVSTFIEKVRNDRIIETTLTIGLALTSFVVSEHFFGLSGVITTVAAGLTLGNIGKTRISSGVVEFMNEFWEYVSFMAVSLVFFFATFNLKASSLTDNIFNAIAVIGIVVIARVVSVYLSFFLSNKLPFFKNEPNVPLKWQHVINWGGLRGVIPLVLVYSIPDSFEYKEMLIGFTLDVFLYSVIVHGLSVRTIMMRLGIHLPSQSNRIIEEEESIFTIKRARNKLKDFEDRHMDEKVIAKAQEKLKDFETRHKKRLLRLSTEEHLEDSLRMQAISFEREHLRKLFQRGYISEGVYFGFEAELDLQEDAIEYPEISPTRVIKSAGLIDASKSFRRRIREVRKLVSKISFIKNMGIVSERRVVHERLELLWARIICGQEVVKNLSEIEAIFGKKKEVHATIAKVMAEYIQFIDQNRDKVRVLKNRYPKYVREYFQGVVDSFVLKDIS